jgi:hypothetical protein
MVRPEGLGKQKKKNPMTLSGFEPTTFWLVAETVFCPNRTTENLNLNSVMASKSDPLISMYKHIQHRECQLLLSDVPLPHNKHKHGMF